MLALRVFFLVAALIAGTCQAEPLVIEKATPAVSSTGELVESIGIETLGGVFTPLLNRGSKTPCSTIQVFSTADDHQTEITLFLFRGNAKMTKQAKSLGQIVVLGIPPAPRGEPQVAVTFSVERNGIAVSALDKKTNSPLEVRRREF